MGNEKLEDEIKYLTHLSNTDKLNYEIYAHQHTTTIILITSIFLCSINAGIVLRNLDLIVGSFFLWGFSILIVGILYERNTFKPVEKDFGVKQDMIGDRYAKLGLNRKSINDEALNKKKIKGRSDKNWEKKKGHFLLYIHILIFLFLVYIGFKIWSLI